MFSIASMLHKSVSHNWQSSLSSDVVLRPLLFNSNTVNEKATDNGVYLQYYILGIRTLPRQTFPLRTFPPGEQLYISWNNCHKSNFYLGTELLTSIQLQFKQRTCFIKYKGRFDQHFWQISSIFYVFATQQRYLIFYVFATQQRYLSSVQLLLENLFYHFSFHFNNNICIFLRGEMSQTLYNYVVYCLWLFFSNSLQIVCPGNSPQDNSARNIIFIKNTASIRQYFLLKSSFHFAILFFSNYSY